MHQPNEANQTLTLQMYKKSFPLGLQEVKASKISQHLANEGGMFVSSMHRLPLPSRRYPWYTFLFTVKLGYNHIICYHYNICLNPPIMNDGWLLQVHTVVQVRPSVMRFYDQLISVQNRKSIHNVCAQWGVYVTRQVFANPLPARTN
jgi:hypothetical protein